ncbi:MAG: 5'-nucleotidase [Victivallaceae bacterium]|nr:5'-nucleotidase [Victivallaceae bacterium]
MAYPIEDKLVIAVASSALFELDQADAVFREKGIRAYREFQREHEHDILKPGIAFPFVRRFLELNKVFPERQPAEVVLLSRNDSDTGLRVFSSIEHYKLGIIRAAFTRGNSPFRYIPAYNVSLFLSANESDVNEALKQGYPAGRVLPSMVADDESDAELRVAFDFDGVVADDSAEKIYQQSGIEAFHAEEKKNGNTAIAPGPLGDLFRKLGNLRKLEDEREETDCNYQRFLKTAIVTARSAPAHRRVITTLRDWSITVDETHFLGGMSKGRILSTLRPHIFFDDQRHPHLDSAQEFSPLVHIPFGIAAKN